MVLFWFYSAAFWVDGTFQKAHSLEVHVLAPNYQSVRLHFVSPADHMAVPLLLQRFSPLPLP